MKILCSDCKTNYLIERGGYTLDKVEETSNETFAKMLARDNEEQEFINFCRGK